MPMFENLKSSAPHIHDASNCDLVLIDQGGCLSPLSSDSINRGGLLWQDANGIPEAGVRETTPGTWNLTLTADVLCHFVAGRGIYKSHRGEIIEIEPGVVVHFKQGWQGSAEIFENTRVIYMLCRGGEAQNCPIMLNPGKITELTDWGPVEEPMDRLSQTSGVLLSKEDDGSAESGIWVCTPGTWCCVLTSDEMCHFLSGRCTYIHDNGEVIQITPDTAAFFPEGWSGQCQVHETVRKVYMIR